MPPRILQHWGLVHGLQYVVTVGCRPLYVVGDSSLILNQVRRNRNPKAAHLVALHRKATRLAAEAGVVTWMHHLRAHNKIADAAANVTMDDAASHQSIATDNRIERTLILP